MNNYICYELEQLEKITGYSLANIKNDINNVYNSLEEKDKEIERLNNIIKNLDKMFEYYFIGNKKYDENTVNTIYIKYIKLKELKESGNNG